jgi:hypothetical protein
MATDLGDWEEGISGGCSSPTLLRAGSSEPGPRLGLECVDGAVLVEGADRPGADREVKDGGG